MEVPFDLKVTLFFEESALFCSFCKKWTISFSYRNFTCLTGTANSVSEMRSCPEANAIWSTNFRNPMTSLNIA